MRKEKRTVGEKIYIGSITIVYAFLVIAFFGTLIYGCFEHPQNHNSYKEKNFNNDSNQ